MTDTINLRLPISLRLPYPPTINHYYVRTNKGLAIGQKGKWYREQVGFLVAVARLPRKFLGSEKLKVTIRVYTPDHIRRDVDNILKCLLDALTKAKVWGDDKQIFDLRVIKDYDQKKVGYVEVTVSEIEEQK